MSRKPPDFRLYTLADELLRRKARISIIHQETGLPRPLLRQAYAAIHCNSPAKGSLKTSPDFVKKSVHLHKQATLFAVFYKIEQKASVSVYRAILAYDRYVEYVRLHQSKQLLDFSGAWMISKWLSANTLNLIRCPACHSPVLVPASVHYEIKCGVCKYMYQ